MTARFFAPDEYEAYLQQRERLAEWYVAGLDIGQSQDPTALCVLRVMPQEDDKATFQAVHLERFKLGTPYPKVVSSVVDLVRRPEMGHRWHLVLDATGVGRPVVDMFKDALGGQQDHLCAVTITAGNKVTGSRLSFGVPKQVLVTQLLILLETGRLVFADMPAMEQLLAEIPDFRVKITTAGNATWGTWRDGAHDDMILSLAIAAWFGERTESKGRQVAHSRPGQAPWSGGGVW